jgi:hypothetical protein
MVTLDFAHGRDHLDPDLTKLLKLSQNPASDDPTNQADDGRRRLRQCGVEPRRVGHYMTL